MNKNYNIEIIVPHNMDFESLAHTWKSNDLLLSMRWNHNEQREYSAYSKHIENLTNDDEILTRIKSLNILLNGSLNISSNYSIKKIHFERYYPKNIEICNSIVLFKTEILEEFPFIGDEEEYKKYLNLVREASFSSYLFSISKADFIVRTLLFQAGLINTYTIEDKILTWNTLYKMVDTISEGCKEINLDINTLIIKKDLKNFTESCNNPFILGINARHGRGDKNRILKTKLTDINQAIELILCLAKNFLKIYTTKKNYINISPNNIIQCEIKQSKQQAKEKEMQKFLTDDLENV